MSGRIQTESDTDANHAQVGAVAGAEYKERGNETPEVVVKPQCKCHKKF